MRECMLTTNDNPFDPFDNFEEWYKIDMQFQYNTCGLVARLVPTDDSMPQAYMEQMKEQILTDWCRMNPLTHRLIIREVEDPDYEAINKEIEDDINSDDKYLSEDLD